MNKCPLDNKRCYTKDPNRGAGVADIKCRHGDFNPAFGKFCKGWGSIKVRRVLKK